MIPTFSSIPLARSLSATHFIYGRCLASVSTIWFSIVKAGLDLSLVPEKSSPFYFHEYRTFVVRNNQECWYHLISSRINFTYSFFGSKSIIASEVSDFPQPDSPTMQSVSPFATDKLNVINRMQHPFGKRNINREIFLTSSTRSDIASP